MSIILYLGHNVNEYEAGREKIIEELISSGGILCESCLRSMACHSVYTRKIKETGQQITITVVWCSKCRIWHSLLPDFLIPHKHYSGNEIESVIIDSDLVPLNQIETEASESTVRRWVNQICGKIRQAVNTLKYLFKQAGQPVSEAAIDAGPCYSELEQILEMAPSALKYSGNKLGLANLWLSTNDVITYI